MDSPQNVDVCKASNLSTFDHAITLYIKQKSGFKNARNFDEKKLIFREANFIKNAKIWLLWTTNVLSDSNGGSLVDIKSYT